MLPLTTTTRIFVALAPVDLRRGFDGLSAHVQSVLEREVLEGLAAGMSNAEIGRQMYLSEDTVKTHARRLYRKLDATDRAAAVANGFRWGLLS